LICSHSFIEMRHKTLLK